MNAEPNANVVEKRTGMRRISDESVKAKTGKGREEWFAILDACDAKAKGHTAGARQDTGNGTDERRRRHG